MNALNARFLRSMVLKVNSDEEIMLQKYAVFIGSDCIDSDFDTLSAL